MAMPANPLEAFVWGAGGSRKTPEQIARERELAAALLGEGLDFSPVAHPLQGLARVATAGAGAFKDWRAGKAEARNATESQSLIAKLLGGGGSGAFPPAPAAPGGVAAAPMDYASQRVAMAHNPDAAVLRQGLVERGLPEHVADAFILNFKDESGLNPGINEANPIVPGSRGGFGLAQWTGPRRKALEAFAAQSGMDVSDPNVQLDFLMTELQGPERKAYEAIMAAPDTGSAAAAIVNSFLRPAEQHRSSREARYLGTPAQQVAESLAVGGAMPTPGGGAIPPMAGGPAPVQMAQAGGGIDPTVLEALSSPYANDSVRQIAGALLQQQMQAQDPMRQLQMQKMQRELERGEPLINAGGGFLYDPNKGDWISAPNAGQADPTQLMRNLEAAGLQPGTPEYQQAVLESVMKPQTQISMAGEKAWDQESAKLFAKRYDDISAGAMNAQQMMGMYDLAEQALGSGVRTGLGGEAELTLRQLGAAMGMDTDPEKLAGGELIRAVQNRMALTMRSPDGGMGMPGALSDRDIKFLKDSQIGIDRSPEGNRRMLQAFRAMEGRKIEIARLADEYIAENGRLDSGFNQRIREYAATNPLFPEPAPVQTEIPEGIDPTDWEFLTPEEKALFK